MNKYENIAITDISVVEKKEKTSELSIQAAFTLCEKKGIKENVKVLLLVTQEEDFLFPATAFVVHKVLGLPKDCIVYDINAGTDGFLIALEIVGGILCTYKNDACGLVITAEQGKAAATIVKRTGEAHAEFCHKTYPDLWDTVWESRWKKGRECKVENFISIIDMENVEEQKDVDYIIFPQVNMDKNTFVDSSVLIPMEIFRTMTFDDRNHLCYFCKGIGTGCSVTEAYVCVQIEGK
jgi:hypothetical protein